jgi:quinol monooxygenase YgiN
MSGEILTSVTATIDADREAELTIGFRNLMERPMPEGLLRTELFRGKDQSWRIETLWRDRAALEAVRTSPEPPAALELFQRVGAKHSHEVFFLEDAHHAESYDT